MNTLPLQHVDCCAVLSGISETPKGDRVPAPCSLIFAAHTIVFSLKFFQILILVLVLIHFYKGHFFLTFDPGS